MGDELGESDGKRGCKRVREGDDVVSSDSTSTTDATTHGDATTKSFHALERANQELKEQVREAKKRESELVFRLTYKEKDIYNLEAHIKELVERSEKNAMHFRCKLHSYERRFFLSLPIFIYLFFLSLRHSKSDCVYFPLLEPALWTPW